MGCWNYLLNVNVILNGYTSLLQIALLTAHRSMSFLPKAKNFKRVTTLPSVLRPLVSLTWLLSIISSANSAREFAYIMVPRLICEMLNVHQAGVMKNPRLGSVNQSFLKFQFRFLSRAGAQAGQTNLHKTSNTGTGKGIPLQ